MIKLTIIGTGSSVFTKIIVTDLLTVDSFKNVTIIFVNTLLPVPIIVSLII